MKMEEYLTTIKAFYDNLALAGQNRPPNNNNNRGFRGRFRGRSNGNKPTCQLCNKIGHTASICWNRFDQNFMGNTSNQFSQSRNQSPNAFMASHETLEDSSWYANTGASHHVTNDLRNLQQKQDYNGQTNGTSDATREAKRWPVQA
ncbi:hypothetical protein EZV62_010413 [Acer yangbiense]|uniref:CCHC-type domain-containing protein n=1 Tax=Acer yangbiense TaxID=1000413 RepID=A0A5C7I3A6_9ROSI|nr:hypothetical protein EZV62_010413 [Acer yangbiense]